MSPRAKHIPDDAQRTSICLTMEDRAAIRWISDVRRLKKDNRITTNDILVDALWHFLEKTEGKTRNQIEAMVPDRLSGERTNKITEMPKPRNKY